MSLECESCGSMNPCRCPSPEQLEERARILEQHRRQAAHEDSIRRQKNRLKIASWRSDPNHPNYVN